MAIDMKQTLENILHDADNEDDKKVIQSLLGMLNMKKKLNSPQQGVFERLLKRYRPGLHAKIYSL